MSGGARAPGDGGEWTPGGAARLLGVSPSTLRTWDHRYGLGPAARGAGKHRRYTEDDLRRLRRMVALTARGVAPAAAAARVLDDDEGDGPPEVAPAGRPPRSVRTGLVRAARRLDEPSVAEIGTKMIAEYGVEVAWQDVFAPALTALGDRITVQGNGVDVEHIASSGILRALRAVPHPEESGGVSALLACVPEEQHSLPLEALGAALSEQDCSWRHLGARVPRAALLDATALLHPVVVVLWAHERNLARLAPVEDLVRCSDSAVAVAGAGWSSLDLPPGVGRPTSLADAVDTVLAVVGRARRTRR
ncbi:MerR family transcriptional regulator [Saccharothrix mutabilis subsp. mutabilis]|uniref:MerR family transcriptional regulator n=1 Tax=Saccharothrix mutabilis subsp. mutabilis TaxID=66855 RepID=A0ABP3DZI3_9PSEU